VLDAGVDLMLHTMLADVRREGDAWQVQLCTKSGLRHVSCRVLIDCSGDAHAVSLRACWWIGQSRAAGHVGHALQRV